MGGLIKLKFCEVLRKSFLSLCRHQNKKALFPDPIFSEGFGKMHPIDEKHLSQRVHKSLQKKCTKLEMCIVRLLALEYI